MKFVWQTTVRDVQEFSPVLSGRKFGGESIFEYDKPLKKVITEENIAFQVDAAEEVPAKGTRLRITVETI